MHWNYNGIKSYRIYFSNLDSAGVSVHEMPEIEIAAGTVKELSQYSHQTGMT